MDEWELDTPEQRKTASPPGGPEDPPVTTPLVTSPTSPSPRDAGPDSQSLPEQVQPGASAELPAQPENGCPPTGDGRPPRKRSLALQVVVALVILLVGMMVGFFVARGQISGGEELLTETRDQLGQLQRALAQSEDRNWAYYRAMQALTAELEEAKGNGQPDTTSTSVAGQLSGVFGEGVYLVGEDIPPGTYDGAVADGTGYWARLEATDGSTSAIIANGIVRGPFVLTIYGGDKAVELLGVTITAR